MECHNLDILARYIEEFRAETEWLEEAIVPSEDEMQHLPVDGVHGRSYLLGRLHTLEDIIILLQIIQPREI